MLAKFLVLFLIVGVEALQVEQQISRNNPQLYPSLHKMSHQGLVSLLNEAKQLEEDEEEGDFASGIPSDFSFTKYFGTTEGLVLNTKIEQLDNYLDKKYEKYILSWANIKSWIRSATSTVSSVQDAVQQCSMNSLVLLMVQLVRNTEGFGGNIFEVGIASLAIPIARSLSKIESTVKAGVHKVLRGDISGEAEAEDDDSFDLEEVIGSETLVQHSQSQVVPLGYDFEEDTEDEQDDAADAEDESRIMQYLPKSFTTVLRSIFRLIVIKLMVSGFVERLHGMFDSVTDLRTEAVHFFHLKMLGAMFRDVRFSAFLPSAREAGASVATTAIEAATGLDLSRLDGVIQEVMTESAGMTLPQTVKLIIKKLWNALTGEFMRTLEQFKHPKRLLIRIAKKAVTAGSKLLVTGALLGGAAAITGLVATGAGTAVAVGATTFVATAAGTCASVGIAAACALNPVGMMLLAGCLL